MEKSASDIILKKFEIETEQVYNSDEELLAVLSKQIEYMLQKKSEFLFSLLYRMDVKEAKVDAAMHPGAPEAPHIGLARLVLDRQKQRNFTREKYKQEPIDDLEEGLEY